MRYNNTIRLRQTNTEHRRDAGCNRRAGAKSAERITTMFIFDNTKYVRSHFKAPKGYGRWAFEVNGKVLFACGTLTEAKKQITKSLKANGVPTGTVIYVAP